MNKPTMRSALLLAGLVLSCNALASNDINKCVTGSGQVTLTDEACPSGAQTVKVISGPPDAAEETAPAEATAAPATQRFTVGRLPPRYVTLMKSTKPARGLALDVETLRAARLNLHLTDNAAQVLRAQRIAGLQ